MAGQAIEDALFLSWLFAHPAVKKSNLKEALNVYDAIRRPRANKVLESSLEAGDVYEMAGLSGTDRAKLKVELESRFDWIWEVSIPFTRLYHVRTLTLCSLILTA